jgi:hypothetical protein
MGVWNLLNSSIHGPATAVDHLSVHQIVTCNRLRNSLKSDHAGAIFKLYGEKAGLNALH